MLFYIGTGLLLGVVTLMDEGMELALGFHIANNLITALLVTTDWGALQTNSVFKDVSEPEFFISILFPHFLCFLKLPLFCLFGSQFKTAAILKYTF